MTEQHSVHCDCGAVEVTMTRAPKVHGYCHCEDCRDLLQVPYHSVLAWEADQVEITHGADSVNTFQHPTGSTPLLRTFLKRGTLCQRSVHVQTQKI